jgi:hypothetical protein
MFGGTERFFRPGYRGHLVPKWIPALEGVVSKLEAGGKVADVSCGRVVEQLYLVCGQISLELRNIPFRGDIQKTPFSYQPLHLLGFQR